VILTPIFFLYSEELKVHISSTHADNDLFGCGICFEMFNTKEAAMCCFHKHPSTDSTEQTSPEEAASVPRIRRKRGLLGNFFSVRST